jgi:tripartite-type tricarboxylate transporter receptor subunit TctC
MIRKLFLAVLFLGLIGIFPASAPADEFYEGKTVRFIVGYRAGGGYDVYTRLIAHHMSRHIPGNPSLIVENMPGAGSLIAANHIFNRAKPDGLTIGVFASGLVREEPLGNPKVQFSAEKFDWIGAPTAAAPSCAIMGFTGLKTWDDVRDSKKELHFGSTGPGATTHDVTLLIRELARAPVKLVAGYGGTSDVRAALQRGNSMGRAGPGSR